jgi:uncharacterized protein
MTGTLPIPAVRPVPGRKLPPMVRLLTRRARRGLPPPRCSVRVAAGLEVPGADGVTLAADHYIPQLHGPRPALLVRCPYGRGFPWNFLFGALFAEQGYHVLLQSCRGTGGSTGRLEPWRHERADGLATVAWLRQQDWFTGKLATMGPSYLGYVQWALATDPPPELRAMIVQVGMSSPYPFLYRGGALALENMLIATATMQGIQGGLGGAARALLRLQRRLRRAIRMLPLAEACGYALGGHVGFVDEWLAHPDADDPYWAGVGLAATPTPGVPVSLLSGWYDVCLDDTLADYRRLRAAGSPVRLTVGPWAHSSAFNDGLPIVADEALRWLHQHLDDSPAGRPAPPVRVHVGGSGEWRNLTDWPPPGMEPQPWYATPGGELSREAPATPGEAGFRYDPADPTPSAGGQLLSTKAGSVDDRRLEARDDVLVFTSAPLPASLEVIGPVSARFRVQASNPHVDLFARLCDVDERGRSRSVCDGLQRHRPDPADEPTGEFPVTVRMSATAHRFRAGHRIRLTVSGGAHPRFARNTGTGEPPATATRLVRADIRIQLGGDNPAVLSLPAAPAAR